MSFDVECVISTLPLDAQLTGTSLLEDTSLVIEDVALVFALAFPFPAVRSAVALSF